MSILVIKSMIDTVNFRLSRADVDINFLSDKFLSTLADNLSNGTLKRHENVQTGEIVFTGDLDNLKVSVNQFYVRVGNGSLCKWVCGDNYQNLHREDLKFAIELLSEIIGLPMELAAVTRLDVGCTFHVLQPPVNYFNHLGDLKFAKRFLQPSCLYYNRHGKDERLCFYDKNREQRDHHQQIPDSYRDCNAMRYEQRYMSRLPRWLGVERVVAAMLYDAEFYDKLLQNWLNTYSAIRKINDKQIDLQMIRTVKQLKDVSVLHLIESYGGEQCFMNLIAEGQQRGDLTAKQASDLRKAIRNIGKLDGWTKQSDAIAELDARILEVFDSYR
jgi:hypothetical protein